MKMLNNQSEEFSPEVQHFLIVLALFQFEEAEEKSILNNMTSLAQRQRYISAFYEMFERELSIIERHRNFLADAALQAELKKIHTLLQRLGKGQYALTAKDYESYKLSCRQRQRYPKTPYERSLQCLYDALMDLLQSLENRDVLAGGIALAHSFGSLLTLPMLVTRPYQNHTSALLSSLEQRVISMEKQALFYSFRAVHLQKSVQIIL